MFTGRARYSMTWGPEYKNSCCSDYQLKIVDPFCSDTAETEALLRQHVVTSIRPLMNTAELGRKTWLKFCQRAHYWVVPGARLNIMDRASIL